MKIGNIVYFTDKANCLAGKFCFNQGIAGEVLSVQPTIIVVDAGLGYHIYAYRDELRLAPVGTIPKINNGGQIPDPALVPSDDGGI
jgi:hypothetical protein